MTPGLFILSSPLFKMFFHGSTKEKKQQQQKCFQRRRKRKQRRKPTAIIATENDDTLNPHLLNHVSCSSSSSSSSPTSSLSITALSPSPRPQTDSNEQDSGLTLPRTNGQQHPHPKKRVAEFNAFFQEIAQQGTLLDVYKCALKKEILAQGHMYVTEHHVCFKANIFGWLTRLAIPFSDISAVEKCMTAKVIPNGIQICTVDGDKYIFASFITRDHAYKLLTNLWQQKQQQRQSQNGNPNRRRCNNDDHDDDAVWSIRTSRSASTKSLASTIANFGQHEHSIQEDKGEDSTLCSDCFAAIINNKSTKDQVYIGINEVFNDTSITDIYQLVFEKDMRMKALTDRFTVSSIKLGDWRAHSRRGALRLRRPSSGRSIRFRLFEKRSVGQRHVCVKTAAKSSSQRHQSCTYHIITCIKGLPAEQDKVQVQSAFIVSCQGLSDDQKHKRALEGVHILRHLSSIVRQQQQREHSMSSSPCRHVRSITMTLLTLFLVASMSLAFRLTQYFNKIAQLPASSHCTTQHDRSPQRGGQQDDSTATAAM